ncbi:MAG: FadR family transcriptional regulator [Propionibacteriaceae bacterium]|nr:FadR family transcriptional regulator [Propionibacteriaceae bacterium]
MRLSSAVHSGSRTEHAVGVLTELITSGTLSSGDFLPSESTLCRQLGVSRPTVRMALRTLETRGLIVTKHGVGVQVTDRTRQAATDSIGLMLRRQGAAPRDMLEVRLVLEGQGAALASRRATEEDCVAMAASIDAMRNRTLSVDENVEADLAFHLRVAEASKNGVLVALIHALRGLLRDTIAATYAVDGRIADRLREHTRVLEAVIARDPEAAEAAMRTHLQRTERLIVLSAAQSSDGS